MRTIHFWYFFMSCLLITACQREEGLPPTESLKSKTLRVISSDNPQVVENFIQSMEQLTKARVPAEDKALADFYNQQGIAEDLKGNYDQSVAYHTKSLAIRKKLGKGDDLAKSFNNLAIVYRLRGQFADAQALFLNAINNANSDECRARALRNYGLLLQEQANYGSAREQYLKALDIWKSNQKQTQINILLNDIRIIDLLYNPNARAASLRTRPGQGGPERLY